MHVPTQVLFVAKLYISGLDYSHKGRDLQTFSNYLFALHTLFVLLVYKNVQVCVEPGLVS